VAATLFGDRLPLAVRYAEWLCSAGLVRGLLGPREGARIWERHLLNCAVVEQVLARGSRVVDVGSGAGLPGVVLALARPDLRVTLLEPLARRVAFLTDVIADLGLAHVDVVRGRAEEAAVERWDVAVARAVAPIDRLATWCLPLVGAGGRLVAMKGSSASVELAGAETALRRAGAARWDVSDLGAGLIDTPTTVVTVWRGDGHRRSREPEKETR
jgi:16S rRNA (guanine527-N7)-methyltransferase